MRPGKNFIVTITTYLLVFLWVYTGIAKLLDIHGSLYGFKRSPFLNHFAYFLTAAVPMTELTLAALLLFPLTRRKGLIGSLVLLSAFTLYIVLVLLFGSWVPCTCGGVIQSLSWKEHIVFNYVFILLTVLSIRNNRSNALQSGTSRKPVTE